MDQFFSWLLRRCRNRETCPWDSHLIIGLHKRSQHKNPILPQGKHRLKAASCFDNHYILWIGSHPPCPPPTPTELTVTRTCQKYTHRERGEGNIFPCMEEGDICGSKKIAQRGENFFQSHLSYSSATAAHCLGPGILTTTASSSESQHSWKRRTFSLWYAERSLSAWRSHHMWHLGKVTDDTINSDIKTQTLQRKIEM